VPTSCRFLPRRDPRNNNGVFNFFFLNSLVDIVFLFLLFLCNVESFTHHLRKGSLPPKSWIAASKLHAKEVSKSNGSKQWEQGSNNNKKQKKTSRSSLNLKFSSKRVKKAKHHGKRKHISLGIDNFDDILEESIQYIVEIYLNVSPCASFMTVMKKGDFRDIYVNGYVILYQTDVTSKTRRCDVFESLEIVIRPRYGIQLLMV
jgi:hypothetical protein